MRMAWVEFRKDKDIPVRIFRGEKAALEASNCSIIYVERIPYADAVSSIREQVFELSGGECAYCGKPISLQTMHMHEKIHRGQGGEISLDNSVALCFACHAAEHKDRNPRFTQPSTP